jgi:hypothetical protein
MLPGANAPRVFGGARVVSTRSVPPATATPEVPPPCQYAGWGLGQTAILGIPHFMGVLGEEQNFAPHPCQAMDLEMLA